jgi:peptide deformylase
MKLPILIHPDPRLKKVAETVPDLSDDLRQLADDMLETMYDAPGIGLAAPQIGCHQAPDRAGLREGGRRAAASARDVQPRGVASSDETSVYEEGCLSIPETFADVTRPAEVTVRWMDRDGNPAEETFDGLWATCVQHEIDHLNGKLFIDYLTALKRQLITRKMVKLKKERAGSARAREPSADPALAGPDPVAPLPSGGDPNAG